MDFNKEHYFFEINGEDNNNFFVCNFEIHNFGISSDYEIITYLYSKQKFSIQHINKSAKLVLISHDNRKINYHGIITNIISIESNKQCFYFYKIILSSPLIKLKLSSQLRYFYNKNAIDILKCILKDIDYLDIMWKIDQKNLKKIEFILQYNQNNFELFEEILKYSKLQFIFIHTENKLTLVIYDKDHHINNLTDIQHNELSYVNNKHSNDLPVINQWEYKITNKTEFLIIKSNARGIIPGQLIKISNINEDINGSYYVKKLTAKGSQTKLINEVKEYQSILYINEIKLCHETQKNYSDKDKLISQDHLPKYIIATVISKLNNNKLPDIDKNGEYLITFPFVSDNLDNLRVKNLISYSGKNHGMHFSLYPGCKVILTFLDKPYSKPFIIGTLPNNKNITTDKNPFTHGIITKYNSIKIQDNPGKENILMQNKNNYIQLNSNKKSNSINFKSKIGDIKNNSHNNITINSKEDNLNFCKKLNLMVNKDAFIQVNKNLSIESKNTVNFKSNNEIRLRTNNLNIFSSNIFKSYAINRLTFNFKSSISLCSNKNIIIKAKKNLNIIAKDFIATSKNSTCFTNKNSLIFKSNFIKISAPLILKHQDVVIN